METVLIRSDGNQYRGGSRRGGVLFLHYLKQVARQSATICMVMHAKPRSYVDLYTRCSPFVRRGAEVEMLSTPHAT